MQYDRAFHKLSRFAKSLIATETDDVKRFVDGLRMSLQKDLSVVNLPSHAVVLNKAIKAEWARDQMKKEQKPEKKKRPYQESSNENHKDKKERTGHNNRSKSGGRCPKCKIKHKIEDCPIITGACFHCKEMGHKAVNCPMKTSL